MAIAEPHQPRYQRRGAYIYYLLGERMVIRTRPAQVRDPRTPAQRRQRLRMRVASTFLKGFQRIVSRGFEPQLQENFRRVGAYQLALGHLMRHALRDAGGGVTLDTARVQLAQGRPSPLGAVRATVQGGLLRVAWTGAMPPRCDGALVGVWNRGKARAPCREADCAGRAHPGRLAGRYAGRVGGAAGCPGALPLRLGARRGRGRRAAGHALRAAGRHAPGAAGGDLGAERQPPAGAGGRRVLGATTGVRGGVCSDAARRVAMKTVRFMGGRRAGEWEGHEGGSGRPFAAVSLLEYGGLNLFSRFSEDVATRRAAS